MTLPEQLLLSDLLRRRTRCQQGLERGSGVAVWMHPPVHRVLGWVTRPSMFGSERLVWRLDQLAAVLELELLVKGDPARAASHAFASGSAESNLALAIGAVRREPCDEPAAATARQERPGPAHRAVQGPVPGIRRSSREAHREFVNPGPFLEPSLAIRCRAWATSSNASWTTCLPPLPISKRSPCSLNPKNTLVF